MEREDPGRKQEWQNEYVPGQKQADSAGHTTP